MKKLYIFLILIMCFFLAHKVCPEVYRNSLSLLLETNFFIPKESNICIFRKTEGDVGSGEGWVYGEDDNYYYGQNENWESESDPSYYILKKGQEAQLFDRFDYKTWDKKKGVKRMTK
ncbi:MAG: hypothetical protein LBU76_09385 [Azoarcus sp.]|jgi:hypothetical protein|nr:hypothetical protein [Azoarcus sp.]